MRECQRDIVRGVYCVSDIFEFLEARNGLTKQETDEVGRGIIF